MANDLRVDLKLGTEEYDRNIRKSKKQMKEYEDTVNVSAGQIAKGVGIVAAAWLGAEGAVQVFNKSVNSTQATGDAFQKMVDEMTSSSNLFFSSMAQADMSIFIDGLKNAITEAGKLSVILDNLGTNKMFSTPAIAKLDREIASQTQIVKDKSKSKEERQAAAAKVEELQKQKVSVKNLTLGQSFDAGYQSFRSGMADVGYNSSAMLTNSAIDKLMDNLRTGKAGDIGAEFKRLFDDVVKTTYDSQGRAVSVYKDEGAQKRLNEFLSTKEGRWSQANYYANQAPDDQSSKLGQAVENLTYAYNAQTQLITEETSNIRARNMIGGSGNKTTAGVKDKSALNEPEFNAGLYINPTTEFDRLQKQIEQHEKLFIPVELVPEEEAGDSFSFNGGINPLDEVKNVDINDQIGQFTNLATAIGSVTGAVNGGASGWISWSASLLTAIGTAIPAIAALITMRKLESKENAKVALTGAAASVAGIPVVGWIMAGAAVASVAAAMASIPKFASGGIVGGGSFNGDKIPALLNSGELVLNDRQQNNLFNMIDRGKMSGNNMASGRVIFDIHGDVIRGVLDKYDRTKDRI